MRRYARIVFGVLVLTSGCNRGTAPPPAATPVVAKPVDVQVEKVSATTPVSASPDAKPPETSPAEPAPQAAPSIEPSEGASPQESATTADAKPSEAAKPERVALLTPGGPLIVDVWLSVDGRPHGDALAGLMKAVLDAGDTDDDGRSTWKELSGNAEYLAGLQPSAPPIGARQMKMYIERFDGNRDGQIQPDEAAAWLGRDMNVTPAAFSLRSNRSYSANARATSRVWQLLDANRDGELSIDETDRAAENFMLLDGDDDRIIAPAELASLREQLEAERNRVMESSREAGRYAALHLEPTFDMDRLEYLLSDLYSPRQTLGPASFSDLAELYKKIDVNSDDWLEQLELADLLTIDPHVEIEVSFNNAEPPRASTPTLNVRHQTPEVALLARPSPDRVVLRLGETLLIVSAHDLTPMLPPERTLDGSQIRLMVHDQYDALFEELDSNADGRLGEREISTGSDRLRSRDIDGDGRLASSELPYSMIVAFLHGEQANEQSYYLPSVAVAQPAASGAPEWFRHADFNGDGDVSRREFLGSFEQFSALDVNRDGFVDAAEAAAIQTE